MTVFTVCIIVQLLRHVQPFVTPWAAAYQAFLSFTIYKKATIFVVQEVKSVFTSLETWLAESCFGQEILEDVNLH